MTEEEYQRLLAVATEAQAEKLEAYFKHQSNAKAARKLKINESSVRKAIKHVREKDARQQLLAGENTEEVENLYPIKGISQYYDAEGNATAKWVKRDVAKETQINRFKEIVSDICEDIIPLEEIKSPKYDNEHSDNMMVYTIGDAHIGMLSWHEETGEDHNLDLAQNDLLGATKLLLRQSVPTKECFIIDVGDYFHSDNAENRTAKSGNSLDVDGRYAKVLKVGLTLATKLVEMALSKHEVVHWRSAIGNHNDHSAIMLNIFMEAYFRNNPRVVIHTEPSMFFYYEFGKNLIGITHGHTVKMDKLGQVMAADRPKEWGNAEHRYWYTGHIHHDRKMELPGCTAESFRTLAPKDAWHAGAGYRSGQDMKGILLNKEYGEISRNTVNIKMVRGS